MTFVQSIKSGFANYWKCSHRASRSEYWYWTLFTILGIIPLIALDHYVLGFHVDSDKFGPLELLFDLVTFLPSFMVMIRRLHDMDRSGYWWLIGLTIIGLIPLIYWSVKRGTIGPNRFGPDPLA